MNENIVSINEIPLNEVKPFIIANVRLQCKTPVTSRICIVGSPGCGKSDLMRQVCQENNWGLVVKYLSNMPYEQITGIPCKVENGDLAKFTKSELFNFDVMDYQPDNYNPLTTPTVLMIDDFHLADKSIQKYLFQLLTYRAINSYKLTPNVAIVLAGNKMTDRALAHTIPAPVMNRIAVYEVKADSEDWLKNFAFKNGVRHDIMSFIHQKGDLYLTQTPVESVPWASPRSWTFLSEQMDEYEELNGSIPISKLSLIANSLIGDATKEFIAYREIFSKWKIADLQGKTQDDLKIMFQTEVSKNPTAAYAIINMITTWLVNVIKKYNFDINSREISAAAKFAYNVMTLMLTLKLAKGTIKPLVIAGTSYILLYQDHALKTTEAKKFNDIILNKFLGCLQNQRDIDWIYYSIVANIFKYPISKQDEEQIKKAYKNFSNL